MTAPPTTARRRPRGRPPPRARTGGRDDDRREDGARHADRGVEPVVERPEGPADGEVQDDRHDRHQRERGDAQGRAPDRRRERHRPPVLDPEVPGYPSRRTGGPAGGVGAQGVSAGEVLLLFRVFGNGLLGVVGGTAADRERRRDALVHEVRDEAVHGVGQRVAVVAPDARGCRRRRRPRSSRPAARRASRRPTAALRGHAVTRQDDDVVPVQVHRVHLAESLTTRNRRRRPRRRGTSGRRGTGAR